MTSTKPSDRSLGVLGACLALAILVAAAGVLVFRFSIWTALLAAVLVICPVIIGWGLYITTRRQRLPSDGRPT
jgi:predicted cobalt transporter CbtA